MLELIMELLSRAARGFVFALPFEAIWFLALRIRKKPQTVAHVAAATVFSLYLSAVLAVTGIGKPFGFFPRVSLLPFVDMIKGPVDTTLNVLLFLPLGVFLPLLYREYDGTGKVAGTAFLLSLAIELTQMFGLGITDINDLLTNTFGACLGYWLLQRLQRRGKEKQKKKLPASSIPGWEEVLALAASLFFSVMVLSPVWRR